MCGCPLGVKVVIKARYVWLNIELPAYSLEGFPPNGAFLRALPELGASVKADS